MLAPRSWFLPIVIWLSNIAITSAATGDPNGKPAPNTMAGKAPFSSAPFTIQKQDGIWWLTSPEGRRCFSFGVCVVGMGASRGELNLTNLGYAAF